MPISSRRQQQHTPRSRCSFPVLPPASLHRAGGSFLQGQRRPGRRGSPEFLPVVTWKKWNRNLKEEVSPHSSSTTKAVHTH